MSVFCYNCKFFNHSNYRVEQNLKKQGKYYSVNVKYKPEYITGRYTEYVGEVCKFDPRTELTSSSSYQTETTSIKMFVDKPSVLNDNNDCPHYKAKFWVGMSAGFQGWVRQFKKMMEEAKKESEKKYGEEKGA